ncbi:pre-mRNA 3'-end-processing factor FIP1 [Anthonomus grandis grandis]|uniref:pre-mRNA 3'-end-processing factor FIP1 n=1 Tax=Anthonomus grandis grandis TaxID=2921223 RepID=UPI0021656243|nr:pre-mRNA 3'-end-processing factor FIP1 [Anthonomus grandis grandis]
MAEEIENDDDQWLYGDNPDGQPREPEAETVPVPGESDEVPPGEEPVPPIEPAPIKYPEDHQFQDDGPPGVDEPLEKPENGEADNDQEDGELKQNGEDEEDLEDDSDEDDVNVVIGDIKTPTAYPQQHSIKRGGLTTTIGDKSKQIQQSGKFQVEEFEQIGTINGVPACDYNLDGLEDKPWRKPGADITDYFNFGFNEDTWKAYCERQKRIRINESGVGIMPLNSIGLPRGPTVVMHDNNKFINQNNFMQNQQKPILSPVIHNDAPKVNVIQVMTADRREYSRKPGFPDMSVPPPMGYAEPAPFIPPPEYGFNPEPEPFYGGYEPTQDSQWMEGQGNPHWQPSEIKTLTGASPPRSPNRMGPPNSRRSPTARRSSSRDRDRDKESRSRSVRSRDGDREKSRRRDRSRSRSRRHKSRSRSPSHRSHKKKKSRRHDDRDSE